MTTSTPPDNTVLVLHLPKVNGQTTPVVGAQIGVPLVAYDLVTDGEGAVVLVDPPVSGDMDPGDVMELWLEGETAALDSETIVDPNAVTTMRIPKGRLHPDRVNLMYYTVTRNSSNIGTSTPSLEILYNRIRPGLKDRLTDPGGHSELKLLLPDAIKNGVGPDFVSAEVCVAYPYCRAYDLITLKCNGELLEPKPKVNPNQAPQPPNPGSEVPITICFTVTRAYLDKAKRLDQKLHFSCTVTDQIGNGPDTDAPWSPVQTVDEDLAGERLPEPILLERMEDYPGDDSSFIELEKLGGNPLLVIVVTSDNRFQPGDTVNAIYTAKLPGQTDVVVPVTGIVEADPFGQKKPCILQVPNDKILANSTVTVVYRLIRAGVDIAISKIAAARVIGENLLELKPPSLVETKDNNLNPVDAKDTLTAVVDYVDLKVGDQISVTWTGPAGSSVGGSHTTPAHEVKSLGEQKIPLPTAVIAYCLSKQATLTYTVTRGSAEPQPSQPFPVNVQALPLNELRAPILKQAANNGEGPELLLHELTAQGLMRFSSFAHIAAGQPVWLRLKGTNNDGSLYDNPLWKPPGAGINAGWVTNGYYEYAAPFNDLKNLKDGSPLTMEFKVGFGRSQVEAEAVTFPERTYSVRAIEIVVPTISSVKGSPSGVEIPNGGITVETAITLTGTASNGQLVDVLDGIDSKGQPMADLITGIWMLPVSGLSMAPHSITAKALYGTGPVSEARTFTVATPFTLDESHLVLSGACISIQGTSLPWTYTGADPVGTFADRIPSSGVPPYTYTSANRAIASVDPKGRVRSEGNGTTTITVSDQLNRTGSFEVVASNVRRLIINPSLITGAAALQWRIAQGAIALDNWARIDLDTRYARSRGEAWVSWVGDQLIPNYQASATTIFVAYQPAGDIQMHHPVHTNPTWPLYQAMCMK